MVAEEALCLQGFPLQILASCTLPHGQSLLWDLAGNAFTGTVALAVFCGLALGGEWRACVEDDPFVSDSADAMSAIEIFKAVKPVAAKPVKKAKE